MVILPLTDLALPPAGRSPVPNDLPDFARFMAEEVAVETDLPPMEEEIAPEPVVSPPSGELLEELAALGIVLSFPTQEVIAVAEQMAKEMPNFRGPHDGPVSLSVVGPAMFPALFDKVAAMPAVLSVGGGVMSDAGVIDRLSGQIGDLDEPSLKPAAISDDNPLSGLIYDDMARLAADRSGNVADIKPPEIGSQVVMRMDGASQAKVLQLSLGQKADMSVMPLASLPFGPDVKMGGDGRAAVLPFAAMTEIGPEFTSPTPRDPLSREGGAVTIAQSSVKIEGPPALPLADPLIEGMSLDLAPIDVTAREGLRGEVISHVRPHPALHGPERAMAIAQQIRDAPDGTTEIRLDPPELGRVRFVVAASDAGVQLVIHAAQPDTADLLRRHLDLLTAELRQAGYASVDVSVGGGGEGQDQGRPVPALVQQSDETDNPAPRRNIAQSGLDLRL